MTDFTLSELLQKSYQSLGQANYSKATGGTTTTIVDTTQASAWTNNQWKNGAAFIVRDAGGANAAPELEFNRISAYDNATTTFTVDTAFTSAPASGDTYMFVDSTFPLRLMIELANSGLRSLGMLELTDITTITAAAEQTEYTGAVAWKRSRPFRVEKARDTDTNDYNWKDIMDWDFETDAAGSTPTIIFKEQFDTSATTVKVWYRDLHPLLTAYNSKVREEVHPEVAVAATVAKAVEWYVGANSGQDDFWNQRLSDARRELERAKMEHKQPMETLRGKTINLNFARP